MSKPLITELKKRMNRNNSNFHFDNLDWKTAVALADLCAVLDERLKELAGPNAKLIAAAPDLLQALINTAVELQRLRDVLLPNYEGKIGEPEEQVLNDALAIIKKALGEQS